MRDLKNRQIAAPPSSDSNTRVIPAAGARNDESLVIARHEAISPVLKRQIAAPPSCVSSFRDGSAAGARNDESNSVAARPFAIWLG